MNNILFVSRLKMILKLRKKITRQELIDCLNTFWKHRKPLLNEMYWFYCYNILINVKRNFDCIIQSSNNRYYYVYSQKLIELI